MKVLVTGDREWHDIETVRRELFALPVGTILIHGACRGLDLMAASVAKSELGFTVMPYPANWGRFGRAAGIIRNQQMIDEENLPNEPIDLCLAFHNDITHSRGTKDMMGRCQGAGIPTKLVTSKGENKQ